MHQLIFFFITGNVDIWSLKTGSDAFQAYSPSTRQFPVTSLCLSRNSNTIVTKYGPFLDVLFRDSSEDFQLYTHLDSGKEVKLSLFNIVSSPFSYMRYLIGLDKVSQNLGSSENHFPMAFTSHRNFTLFYFSLFVFFFWRKNK